MDLKEFVKRHVTNWFERFGLIIRVRRVQRIDRTGLNLNVGSGTYDIKGFVSLDYFTEHYHKNRKKFGSERIHYDMRSSPLPYDDETVDNIYCSHVIEHIETEHVERFFSECNRVLKADGFLRIACPDSRFLHTMALMNSGYYRWHKDFTNLGSEEICFFDEVATHRKAVPSFGLDRDWRDICYSELMYELRSDGCFDLRYPHLHINAWDHNRLEVMGTELGFCNVVRSTVGGSASIVMQGLDMDVPHNQKSLYIDFQKPRITASNQ